MFDLDYYMNLSLEVKVGGQTLHVRQPSVAVTRRVDELEKDITESNLIDRRVQILKVLLDNNIEGIQVDVADLENYPLGVVEKLVERLRALHLEAEKDPN